ncbi:MAG TPA: helix-hairpin-helix domain-containing protein [Candidatus Copromorpha excrementigallinarum]|uniref:Helix-hairpin-helix domain-containing protein n=1 Tax=Candidatus Allocopromorpha excrementigallinarum TaxID=2840742 RepID=A0A9D1L658_9FIRM|nr:helix-hairpin-helix domain-containing protein [Candidatus Copromorpha excrementigallinarum]
MKRLLEELRANEKLNKFLEENRSLLIKAAVALFAVIAAFAVFSAGGEEREASTAQIREAGKAEEEKPPDMVVVDVGGEVRSPMVVELEEGSRIQDAIEAAGGLTENADLDGINRAAFVNDGDKILIPSVEEGGFPYEEGAIQDSYGDGRININTADSGQLQEITGVGPVTAEKIISYREENGRFDSIEDIKNVSGIGDKTFEKMKDEIKV